MVNYWATNAGAGTKAGTSLGNAAVTDPADANDIWTIINASGAPADDTTVKLCGDAAITATCTITQDATDTHKIIIQGRNAGDTADAKVTIDAGGGAFPIFNFTAADFWEIRQVYAYNTSKGAGNNGFTVGANADYVSFYGCEISDCYRGIEFSGSSGYGRVLSCHAHDNGSGGFLGALTTLWSNSQAIDNGGDGFYRGVAVDCLADNNADGFRQCLGALRVVAYGNSGDGIEAAADSNCIIVDSIVEANGAFGANVSADATAYLLRVASKSNTSGRISGDNYIDVDGIEYTVTAFLNAAAGDFSLNRLAGGGAMLRGIARVFPDGLTTGYDSLGIAGSRPGTPNKNGGRQ
jgi:hypothetical protein